jgi:peptidyl-prolyl cis-trans isomerase B (cyclophilin B)
VDPLERTLDFSGPFPRCIEPDVAYEATFVTNFGEVVVALDGERVPNALNAFIVLAEYGYYDDTAIMRIAPSIDIIQGGAPHTQDNADDGAGFPIPDEGGDFVEDGRSVTGPFTYKPGQLVLARTAAVDGSGPQFFFTIGPNASLLDAGTGVAGAGSYLVLGDVSMGLDVLVEIQSLSDPADFMGRPTEMVIVETVDITPSLLDVDQAALFCEAGTTIDGLGSRYTTSEEAETLFRALESWSDQLWAYAPDDLLDQAELLHAFYSLLLAEGEDVDFSIFVLETDSFIDRVYDGLGIEDADDFADIRARIADDC